MPGPNYLIELKGRPRYYAQRAVPLDLQERLGTKLWRKKAGNTVSEARTFLALFIAETEEIIRHHRKQPSLKEIERERLLLRGRPPEEVFTSDYFQGTPEEAEELTSLPAFVPLTVDEIITRSVRLKSPAHGTIREWHNSFKLFTEFTGNPYPLSATREDAQQFRDHLLSTYKVSTAKKVIRFLSGHWELCVDEGAIEKNIWNGVLKYVKNEDRKEKEFVYVEVDEKAKALDPQQKMLYDIIRYSGLRIQEALDLRACDIDRKEQVIIITDHEHRQLKEGIKNTSSRRKVPISTKLATLLPETIEEGETLLFERWRSKAGRWNTPAFFQQRLGIGPHIMRGHLTSCLREAGINERIIGDLLGHAPTTTTSKYGTATMHALRDAIEKVY